MYLLVTVLDYGFDSFVLSFLRGNNVLCCTIEYDIRNIAIVKQSATDVCSIKVVGGKNKSRFRAGLKRKNVEQSP